MRLPIGSTALLMLVVALLTACGAPPTAAQPTPPSATNTPPPTATPAPTTVAQSRMGDVSDSAPRITERQAPAVVATPIAAPTSRLASIEAPLDATPTPRPTGTPPRVGLQAGHWQTENVPAELERFRTATGSFAGGYSEAAINLDIAQRVAAILEAEGVVVDILPAAVPPRYDADVFVSLHADGTEDPSRRGYKGATPWRTSRAAQQLNDALNAAYASTGIPYDDTITRNMRGYYTFNYNRYQHAIARTTPGVIFEMGYLTNADDRAFLVEQGDVAAAAIAAGILQYLEQRDPNNGGALLPPEYRHLLVRDDTRVTVFTAPDPASELLHPAEAGSLLVPFDISNDQAWYNVYVPIDDHPRGGVVGWARRDDVEEATDDVRVRPYPTPTPDGSQ